MKHETKTSSKKSGTKRSVKSGERALTPAQNMRGKRVLVTGAARGIGKAIALRFAESGASVCFNAMRLKDVDAALIEKANANYGGDSFAVQADVRDVEQIAKMFKKIDARWGGVDVLVNNAGVESVVSAMEIGCDEWDRVMATNLRGAFFCSQAAAQRMREQEAGGVVLNISSIHDAIPRLGTTHYCISKAGLSMMTKSLALEWAEYGIRVVGLAPGAIETDINREVIENFGRQRFEEWIPARRLGTVNDVANVACFLASDAASYISGTTLQVDGAYGIATIQYDPRKE